MPITTLSAPEPVRVIERDDIRRAESLLAAGALLVGLTPSIAAAYADSAIRMLIAYRDQKPYPSEGQS